MYSFSRAAVTNCHKLGGFNQQKFILSQFGSPEARDPGVGGARSFRRLQGSPCRSLSRSSRGCQHPRPGLRPSRSVTSPPLCTGVRVLGPRAALFLCSVSSSPPGCSQPLSPSQLLSLPVAWAHASGSVFSMTREGLRLLHRELRLPSGPPLPALCDV